MINQIIKWINKNRKEFYILFLILALGTFFRLFRIGEYMTFLGDEGRDAIIVRRLLVDFDPILIGPGTSIGNMYLGPLYYYLSAPFLFLANYSPVGPSVMVAVLGIATIFLIWYISRIWFGKTAAVVASLLYSLSPVIIIYNRSSWNPNIMPFFSLLTIYSLWKIWKESKYRWFAVMGVSLAFVLQSHYLGLLLVPTIIIFLILKYLNLKNIIEVDSMRRINQSATKKIFFKHLFFGVLVFFALMSPLLIFDIRHNFMNYNAIKTFFTQRETTLSVKPWKSLPNLLPIARDNISARIVSGTNLFVGTVSLNIMTLAVLGYFIVNVFKIKNMFLVIAADNNKHNSFAIMMVWIFVGIIGLGLYKQHIYDHYFGFLYPAIFIFIGWIAQTVYNLHFDGLKIIVSAWVILLLGTYFVNSPLRGEPNHQMYRAQKVAEIIKNDTNDSKFNLAVIAERNYEDGYQYFLEKDLANIVDIDALRLSETTGEYLYVVCEITEEKCDPVNSPKAEIANFGWSKIVNKWGISGVTVFKLGHVEK